MHLKKREEGSALTVYLSSTLFGHGVAAFPVIVAESFWEKPSVFGIPFGALFLFWLAMQSLQKNNKSSEQSRSELSAIRRQQERARREKERKNKMPKCPFCGGRLEGEYPKCMHCASDLAWRRGKPLKRGDEKHFIPPARKTPGGPPPRKTQGKDDSSAWKTCSLCGMRRFVAMFRDFDSSGRPSGPTHAVCSTCRDRGL